MFTFHSPEVVFRACPSSPDRSDRTFAERCFENGFQLHPPQFPDLAHRDFLSPRGVFIVVSPVIAGQMIRGDFLQRQLQFTLEFGMGRAGHQDVFDQGERAAGRAGDIFAGSRPSLADRGLHLAGLFLEIAQTGTGAVVAAEIDSGDMRAPFRKILL